MVREFVEQSSEIYHCPPDFMALPTLTLLGAAIGRSRVLAVNEDWLEPPRLWTAIVSPIGTMKSPTMKFCCRYIHDRQLTEEALAAAWEPPEGEEETPRPHAPIYWVDNVTLEAMGPAFLRNPRGIAALPDELSAWVKRMGQYKGPAGSADEKDFLSIWNGDPINVLRKTAASVKTGPTFLAMYSGIQPEILARLNPHVLMEDGFMARILLAEPPILPVRASLTATPMKVKRALHALYEQLYNLRGTLHQTTRIYTPRPLEFLPHVGKVWKEWHDDHCIKTMDVETHLRGPFSKMRGYSVSIALILQLAKDPLSQAVEMWAVDGAVQVLDEYFKPHVERLYPWILYGHDDHEVVLSKLQEIMTPEGVTQSEWLRATRNMKSQDFKRVVEVLKESGVVQAVRVGKKTVYTLTS